MSNYNVAYSGLDNVSKAIDAVSNNIANASTVGYKAGQWVFADQFMKATSTTDAARTGMGTQNLSVRRPMIQGAIANSTNPLDLAISGNGMFRLLQDIPQGSEGKVSPESLFYTRNGQFSVSRDGFIVNENGMYLTGYQPDRYGKAITDDIYGNWGLLKVPEANYFGNKTGSSVISALLDSTSTAFTSTTSTPFDPSQNTFNNKTSQTIFDNDGNAHTLDVYYRRIADSTFTIKSESDGTGYTYAPSKSSTPYSAADIDKKITLNANSVLRVDTAPLATAAVGTTVTIGTGTFALDANPDANVQGKRVFLNGVDTGYVVQTDPANNSALTLAAGTSPSPSGNGNVTFNQKDIVTFYDVSGTNTLNMTLVTPDGHEILVQGKSNMPSSGLDLTAVESRVEVYSSIDDQFFDHNATSDYFSNRQASQAEMQVSASAYKPVTVMHFVGGRNIDALVTDPLSGNPKFRTDVTLSAKVTNQALGTSQLVFNLDLTDTTMQSGPFQISKSYQDGEAFAKLSNLTIDNEGRIAGVYGGGRVQYVGQIALVHFDAFEAMAPVGKNAFAATVESGTEDSANGVYRGRPGTGQLGEIRSQALESSNVDLSGELVRLMILQRTYSANSQSMKAVDQVMRDTLQMIS